MKYLLTFLLVSFFTCVNHCAGQSKSNFGIQFSPGIALQHRASDYSKQISANPKAGFKTGLFFQFKLSEHFNAETSLSYTLLNNSSTSKTEDKNGKYLFGQYHSGVHLTMMFQYQTDLKRNLLIRSGIGLSINYMKKDDFYFEDKDFYNNLSVKRRRNYQINSSIGLMKKESKFYFGVQLDLGLFINYVEDIQIQNSHQVTYWIKSSSAFFVMKYYLL